MVLKKRMVKDIFQNKLLLAGIAGLFVLLCVALLAPVLTRYGPYDYTADILNPPGTNGHLLGTNHMGQDVWSMLVYGTRVSLSVALLASLISAVLGIFIGAAAGFFGGAVDGVLSEFINVFLMIPVFFLIILVSAVFGSNIYHMMLMIGLTSWPGNAKLMRIQAYSIRERTYIKGAVAIGESKGAILLRYIIPNGIYPVITNSTMGVANAILAEAGYSFLGLGDPSVISWGRMIYDGKAYLSSAWWLSAFAAAAIVLTVLCFYCLGDGLASKGENI